jgi:hypothetical protein
VTSILDLDELLSRTVDIICAAYGFYFSCVYLLDESGKWLILRAAHGKAGEQMLAKEHKLLVGGRSVNHPRRKRRGFHRTGRRELLRTACPDQYFLVPDIRCTAGSGRR